MSQYCQIVHVYSDSDVGTPCNNRAVAECADCGAAICADCRNGAADSHSVRYAVITTSLIHA
jgi:hypothetical protein